MFSPGVETDDESADADGQQTNLDELRAAMDQGGAMGQVSNEELAQMLLEAMMRMDQNEMRMLAGGSCRAVRGNGTGPAGRRCVLPLPHAPAARRRRTREQDDGSAPKRKSTSATARSTSGSRAKTSKTVSRS